jgi:hypothetical protein
LTAFEASFILPNSAGTLTLGLPEVNYGDFYYADPSDYFILAGDLGTTLPIDNGITGPLGLFAWDFNAQTAITTEALQTSPVPEPASTLLIGAPLAILLGWSRARIRERGRFAWMPVRNAFTTSGLHSRVRRASFLPGI